MPREYKPKIGGNIHNQNIEIIRDRIIEINATIKDMVEQMEGIIDASEAASNLLNKKVNLPYVPPALKALSIITLQMSRFNNRLTNIRNMVGEIVTAAEENYRLVTAHIPDLDNNPVEELKEEILELREILLKLEKYADGMSDNRSDGTGITGNH